MYRSMQNIDRQHDVKSTINDGRARIAMNGEIPSVPITTLAGISSLTDLLPEMPLPSPLPHTLSNKSLLFHPRVAEEANNLLKLRDENLVPLLANSLSQTTSDHIELKDHYATTDQLIDCQFQPELLRAIVQKNPTVFKTSPASQRHGWHVQRSQQMPAVQQQIPKQNYHQSAAVAGQPRMQSIQQQQNQQFQQQQQLHHQKLPDGQQQTRHVSQSPHQQMQSPQQSMQQSPHQQMQSQYHPQQQQQQQSHRQQMQQQHQQHMQPIQQQQHSQQGVIAGTSPKMPSGGANFNAKSVIASNYNTAGAEYVNNAINTYPATCRPMQVNRMSGGYGDGIMNSTYSPQQQQHNYASGQQNVIHQVAGTSKSQFVTNESQPGSYGYSNVVQSMGMQSSSPMLASMPTPTPTPSSTPTQSPTRFIQRASVITSENNQQQQNGMYLPNVDKFLLGDDINMNMNDQSMVPELSSSVLLQSNVVEQLPSILDPSTNQPIQIPPQLQSQIESHLQLNGQQHLGGQMDSHDMYPADIGNLLNDVSSSIPIISGDLSMTPPLSSSVSQLDSVPHMQVISPHINYDLPENVTPLLDSEKDLFENLKEITKKEPVIKLHRLTENDLKQTLGMSSNSQDPLNKKYPIANNDLALDYETKKNNWFAKHMVKDLDQKKGEYEISISERIAKRKRNSRIPDVPTRDEDYVPKPKLKKLERKLVPVLEKLSVDELMETNTYQKFNQSIEKIFENMEDADMSLGVESDDEIPEETLIQKYQLLDLCSEAAKLKSLGCMESIPTDRLIRLLGILEKNIRSGIKVSPIDDDNDDEYQRKLWLETVMERVSRAVDASLIALYVLTSPNMHKKVYLEDVIDRIIMFAKYQLHNTIYPAYDPVYRTKRKKDIVNSSRTKKKPNQREVRDKSVIGLYTKLVEVVSLLAELLNIQPLTDNSILHLSTLGVGPFFVEGINELQLNALKLVTSIFMKYEKHRKLLLDDILASMARLPSSKQSLRSYRLSSQEHIQMLTALVLQLIQCMVVLPKNAGNKRSSWDPDAEISRKFKAAQASASNFLVVFLAKCSSKSEEIDYRPLFENFVQDLLTTVNKPEWPVSELMLSVLGKLLVSNFINKGVEMPLRVASLDYLGVVAARLRKDSVTSHLKLSTIDTIIKDIRAEEFKDDDKPFTDEDLEIKSDEERTQFLQRVLLDYLAVKSHSDESQAFARHFYICQWYQDALSESNAALKSNKSKPKKKNKKRWKGGSSDEESESSEEETEEEKKETKQFVDEKFELRKQFFLSKVNPFETVDSSTPTAPRVQTEIQHTYIDYESAELVSRYLASKRPFSKSFETFLKHIINVLMESSVLIRTKAMKCLTMIVEADPGVLALKQMQMGVRNSFLDHSTSVREAAVDLVGKFILSQPNLIDDYYDMLSARILDTGVSVRKRVIKILKDICVEYPDYPKIPEICVKMIRRVNDEDGIRKLVMEVFQNMWFTPVREHGHHSALEQKVMNITEVVVACKDMGLEWFEQLLVSLFKPKEDKDDSTKVITEPPKVLVTACKQIVDSLVDNVITLDGRGGNAPQRLVACVTTLYLFAKIRPQLLVGHAITLQPYLSLKCQTSGDYKIISCVARILEIVVPLLEHASEMFLSQLEEDSVKLIFQHDQSVILSCISCLGSVVNNVTRNFTLIRDCFLRYFNPLKKLKSMLESGTNANMLTHPANRASIRRSMYIVGLMLRFFDFKKEEVRGDKLPENVVHEVFETLSYFMHVQDQESCKFALISVGSMCIRYYDYMMGAELKAHYQMLLTGEETPVPMKVQVLNNIKFYLQEEEKRMIKQDEEWASLSKQENLKEMNDVSSGMASTIIQIYLKDILEAFLHHNSAVRQAALGVIQMILAQGLVHPVQIVPYLICMSTDDDRSISSCADKQLQDIEKKYPGFIHMKAQTGIKLSFKLQKIIQGMQVARGFRAKESELPTALNGFLYSILRSKQQRRALVLSILKQFEEQVKTSLAQMLYLADNVAYFPYQVLDEPLFIIHHINIMISVTGTNLLQSFKESLLPNPKIVEMGHDPAPDEDDDEDEESLLKRVPDDITTLQECITASQGCLMLLVLKQHLKTLYGFTDSKIALYSPSESAKVYEKSLNRKNNSRFHPKAALHKLQTGVNVHIALDEKAKRELIAEYLEFKQLIISLDREDEDENDDKNKSLPPVGVAKANNVCNVNVADESRINLASSSAPPTTPIANSMYLSQQPTGSTNFATPTTPNAVVGPFAVAYAQQVTPLRVPKVKIIAPRPPSDSPHHSHSHSHRSHKSKKSDRHKKHHHKRKKKSYRSDESDDADSDPDYSL